MLFQDYISKEAERQIKLLHFIMVAHSLNSTPPMSSNEMSWWEDDSQPTDLAGMVTHSDMNEIIAKSTAANRWRNIQCTPARDSLCHLQSRFSSDYVQSEYVSRLFPNYPNQVFLTQRDSSILPADVARCVL